MANDDVIQEFLLESQENLDQLDRDFLALEADPTQKDRLAGIFRTIHTIKGTSGFLGFTRLEHLTHAGESVLSRLRDGVLSLTPAITSDLLAMVDRVRAVLATIGKDGREGPQVHQDLVDRLLAIGTTAAAPPPTSPSQPATPPPSLPLSPPLSPPPAVQAAPPPPSPAQPSPAPPSPPPPPAPAPSTAAPADPAPEATTPGDAQNVADGHVRVAVELLDKLMNLVGELVLTRNRIVRVGARVEDPAFAGAAQRLELITTELQEHVMRTRMQPIGNVWNRLPRLVRDLAMGCGKQVRVEMHGRDTELDRTILEAIKDPLIHVVRNAVDHGLETPDVRAAQGKPRTGTLTLRAFHEGGKVVIEVRDDGAGMALDRIRQKAVHKGLLAPDAQVTDAALLQLVFLPGFSTAEKVTNVSGRGVGMDVVKTNVEKVGGTVELRSQPGAGTTLSLKIPLTLAIIPALVVHSGGHRFAIPQVSLLELVRLGDTVEHVRHAPVFRLRGALLPLIHLDEQLRLQHGAAAAHTLQDRHVMVLQAESRRFGLVVDEVHDTEEIVVKPLGRELKSVRVFAGSTIMGDGRVALIVDVVGLARRAGVLLDGPPQAQHQAGGTAQSQAARGESESLLLFGVGGGTTMAVPLASVARLEEVRRGALEQVGNRLVTQYRGQILPLIDVASATGGAAAQGENLQIIVHTHQDRSVGLVVDHILDVVEHPVAVEQAPARAGMAGAAIIQGRVTQLLDVNSVIAANVPSFFERGAP